MHLRDVFSLQQRYYTKKAWCHCCSSIARISTSRAADGKEINKNNYLCTLHGDREPPTVNRFQVNIAGISGVIAAAAT